MTISVMRTAVRPGSPTPPQTFEQLPRDPATFLQRKVTLSYKSGFSINQVTVVFLNCLLMGMCNRARILAFMSKKKSAN